MEIDPPVQQPCDWCLADHPSLLLCRCEFACGEPDCPNAREYAEWMQPVPTFVEHIAALIEETKPAVINEAVSIEPEDYEKAILRVVELHTRCECRHCAGGLNRSVCASCQAFYPCPTIHALRDQRFGREDTAGSGIDLLP